VSTDPRTAVVNIFVTKPLEIDEPDWCAGHPDQRAEYKADISHDGPEHVMDSGGREVFRAFLTQAPFSTVDRTVGLHVEVANLSGTHTPAEVEQLADDLTTAAVRLRALGRELARILDGGGQ
jgi:hypothetical protein